MSNINTTVLENKLSLSIKEFSAAVGIGRSNVYVLIKANKIKTFKFGKRVLIPKEEALRFARGEVR